MRVVCAWCRKIIKEGEEPTSHGCCPECAAKEGERMDAYEIAKPKADLAAAQNVKALLAEEVEVLKQERDEARATKDLHKERQQQETVRAEKAEAANAVMADALDIVIRRAESIVPTTEIIAQWMRPAVADARKALASLIPAAKRIQEIVKAAKALEKKHKLYPGTPCDCDICKIVRAEGGETDE